MSHKVTTCRRTNAFAVPTDITEHIAIVPNTRRHLEHFVSQLPFCIASGITPVNVIHEFSRSLVDVHEDVRRQLSVWGKIHSSLHYVKTCKTLVDAAYHMQ